MPYNNVPEDKWDDMDRCVDKVLTSDFIKKNGGTRDKAKPRAIAICYKSIVGEKMKGDKTQGAKWTRAYINSLPDSSFAYVEPCYKSGKTNNKNARHLPFKDANGKIDLPHLRNALARANQIKPVCPETSKDTAIKSAMSKLRSAAKRMKIGEFSKGSLYALHFPICWSVAQVSRFLMKRGFDPANLKLNYDLTVGDKKHTGYLAIQNPREEFDAPFLAYQVPNRKNVFAVIGSQMLPDELEDGDKIVGQQMPFWLMNGSSSGQVHYQDILTAQNNLSSESADANTDMAMEDEPSFKWVETKGGGKVLEVTVAAPIEGWWFTQSGKKVFVSFEQLTASVPSWIGKPIDIYHIADDGKDERARIGYIAGSIAKRDIDTPAGKRHGLLHKLHITHAGEQQNIINGHYKGISPAFSYGVAGQDGDYHALGIVGGSITFTNQPYCSPEGMGCAAI